MKCIFRSKLIAMTVAMLSFASCAGVRRHPDHPYRYSDVDMPVSLAVGTVRTPEFPVRGEAYFIMLQARKGQIPFFDMVCMMGITSGPLDKERCSQAPLLETNWTVWDGAHIVAQGSNRTEADAEFTNEHLFKFLGMFMGEAGRKYAVEVKFTRDGTPLNAADPHFIVILVRNH